MSAIKREVIIGNCRLLQGDCMEIMPLLEFPDKTAIIADLPYGIKMQNGFANINDRPRSGEIKKISSRQYRLKEQRHYDAVIDWDNEAPQHIADCLFKMAMPLIFWGANYFEVPQSSAWLIWDKKNTMPTFSDCELAWTNLQRQNVKRFEFLQNGFIGKEAKDRVHPTQKPIALIKWCIEQLPKDITTIFDPTFGSGTTGVACVKLGRSFIGIEQDPDYFDIAVKRITEAYKQGDLFLSPPAPKPVQGSLL